MLLPGYVFFSLETRDSMLEKSSNREDKKITRNGLRFLDCGHGCFTHGQWGSSRAGTCFRNKTRLCRTGLLDRIGFRGLSRSDNDDDSRQWQPGMQICKNACLPAMWAIQLARRCGVVWCLVLSCRVVSCRVGSGRVVSGRVVMFE